MLDRRFPNRDELTNLRSKGVFAVSQNASRLSAALCALIFMINIDFLSSFQLLSEASSLNASELHLAMQEIVISMLQTVVIYLAVFCLTTLLQSKFFFGPSRLFSRTEPIFQFKRVFSAFDFMSIVLTLALCAVSILLLLLGQQFVFGFLGQLDSAGYDQALQALGSFAQNLGYYLTALIVVIIPLAAGFAQIRFRFRHRVAIKGRA